MGSADTMPPPSYSRLPYLPTCRACSDSDSVRMRMRELFLHCGLRGAGVRSAAGPHAGRVVASSRPKH